MEQALTIAPYTLNAEQEKKEILRQYRALLRVLKSKLKKGDKELVRTAFEMAADAHKTMRRKSGEPYILHPLAVAIPSRGPSPGLRPATTGSGSSST